MDLIKLIEDVSTGIAKSIVLDGEVEKVSQERLAICKNCEHNTTPGKIVNASRCNACGCFLKLKSRVMSANCGIEALNQKNNTEIDLKWFAKLDPKSEEELNELI